VQVTGTIPTSGKGAVANTPEAAAAFMTAARKQKISSLVASYLQKYKLTARPSPAAAPAPPEWD
jgi:hypothetical protein